MNWTNSQQDLIEMATTPGKTGLNCHLLFCEHGAGISTACRQITSLCGAKSEGVRAIRVTPSTAYGASEILIDVAQEHHGCTGKASGNTTLNIKKALQSIAGEKRRPITLLIDSFLANDVIEIERILRFTETVVDDLKIKCKAFFIYRKVQHWSMCINERGKPEPKLIFDFPQLPMTFDDRRKERRLVFLKFLKTELKELKNKQAITEIKKHTEHSQVPATAVS